MTEDEEVKRGHEAERLLTNPLLEEAFTTIRTELESAWRDSPSRDGKGREKLWIMVKLLGRVETHLASVATTGKLARKSIAMRAGLSVSPL